ncbi:MAG: hypothetical protein ACTHNS_11085 [Marmoricola sp.]
MLLALVAGCGGDVSIAPPTPARDDSAARAGAAQRSLAALAAALGGGHAAAATGLSHAVADNGRALGARDVRLRYVDENLGAPSVAARARFGPAAWVASVQVAYRLPVDTGVTRMTTAVTFVADGGAARIVAVGGYGERSPLWMRGPAAVRRSGRVTVVATGAGARDDAARFVALGRRALADVHAVLPRWTGSLVLDVPRDEAELDAVLDADQRTYADIAAVTTTVDGSLDTGSPVHVFVNPAVFAGLRRQGAQVVISHEATHVATDGPFSDMPTWLLEGFADYVALDHAGVPVGTAASQVLARIRAHGLPRHLPSASDLQPTASGLGATYEEAWLACRYLGRTYGEAALVRFYDTVRAGTSLDAAFREVLGISQHRFVQGWRADLARLAG